jgi:hypothetical protein
MWRANLSRLLFGVLFSVTIVCFLPARVTARDGPDSDAILVRSRLPLPGGPVQQMSLLETGGRDYLYISQADQAGYVVVDVTDDRHPKTIKEIVQPHGFEHETLEMVGTGLGFAARPESAPSRSAPAIQVISGNPVGQSIRLLDLSDPSHPRTLKTFNGVTSVVLDVRRNMIYLTNGDGLWILRHRIDEMRQLCEEVSQYQAVPMMCSGY